MLVSPLSRVVPFQIAFPWLVNRGDPNHLLTGSPSSKYRCLNAHKNLHLQAVKSLSLVFGARCIFTPRMATEKIAIDHPSRTSISTRDLEKLFTLTLLCPWQRFSGVLFFPTKLFSRYRCSQRRPYC